MSSVRNNTGITQGGLSADLLEQLVKAATKAGTAREAIAALTELSAAEAVAWLIANEATARALCTSQDLTELIDSVVKAGLAGRNSTRASDLAKLVSRYADLASSDTLATVANTLPAVLRNDDLLRGVHQALEREPRHTGLLRVAIDHAIRQKQTVEAHRLLTELGRADDSQATIHYIWRKRSELRPTDLPLIRVALMSSFTIDPLVHYLDLECRAIGLQPEIYVTPFNSWAQEIIAENSELRQFNPEVAFLSVSIDDLIGDLGGATTADQLKEAGETALQRVLAAANQFASWSDALFVVHSFHSAHRDPFGILEGRTQMSRSSWLAELNARLSEGLQEITQACFLDMNEVLLRRAGGAVDNPKMRHMAAMRLCGPVVGEVARAYARYIAPVKGLTRKCVVLDLDNTLWGGIVGEDGLHGIRLGGTSPGSEYQEFQRYLRTLTDRGFLLAINSKNNPEDALEVIRSHEGMILREDAFSTMRINWRPKPDNMLSIAEELNIGVDSLIFLDDNPHERELMRQALPQVLTPDLPSDPSLYRTTVECLPQLQKLAITEEDRTRTHMYQAKRQREQTRVSAGSLEEYLSSLDITVTIGLADEASLPRVHQLFQRTNQFNLTTRRYPAADLEAMAADPARRLYTLRARDRFGDHGLVATALVRAEEDTWSVDSFLMSCRVIGYGVETALLATLGEDARAAGATTLVGEFIETAKNAPARDFYARHDFSELGTKDGVTSWRLSLEKGRPTSPEWIRREVA